VIKFKQTQNLIWGQLRGQLWRRLLGQLEEQLRDFRPTKEQRNKAWELLSEKV